ncbi:MFS general substrate transporter [Periconia macrospinosa]|uniref:MFS general substrate transporter n=1 Tax=Periconia macrospinosa TaxID=97972 RepID=A0A2V1EBG8_9PLEO|nr:MFS general substrate transporter [Periconia macrospinosa]
MATFNFDRPSNDSASQDVIADIISDLGFDDEPNTLNMPSRPKALRYSDGSSYQSRWSTQSSKFGHDRHFSTGTIFESAEEGPSEPTSQAENASQTPPDSTKYPTPAKTAVIMFSLYISIFLVALDRTIIGPAIPAITNQFRSLGDVGWYGSAYMLTSCGFILLYGRVYTFFSTKTVFLSGIALFEAGSAICGAANSSLMLIIGRAVAGFGSSGIFTGAILIMLNTVPLHKRPLLQGLFGACFGVASVTGPLLGGAFTGSSMTWRWCFYINLPLGGITMIVVILLLKLDENKPKMETWAQTVRNLDPIGTVLFLPSITCLLLALEWGAAEYAWSSPQVIALFIVFAVLLAFFSGWQYYTRHTTATIPARVFVQRSVIFGGLSQFCVGATMLTFAMYIPLWFQAIRSTSAMQSGIRMIPLVLSVVVGSISSGGLVQRIGYYTPFMIAGSCFMAVGAGLITTWTLDSSSGEWIGYQVLLGFGVGWTMQQPNLAIQVVLPKPDVPTGTALLSLCQTLGGAVFVAVGQNLFIDRFSHGLRRVPGINPGLVLHSGATNLRTAVPHPRQHEVLLVYNNSLTQGPFFAALIIACLSLPAAIFMEWRSVKESQGPPKKPEVIIPDEEKAIHKDENTTHTMDAFADPGDQTGINNYKMRDTYMHNHNDELPLPTPSWKNFNRPSGNFSAWVTAVFNPDLKDELKRIQEMESGKIENRR